MGTADPPAAVVQRLQEEHLRKDVIGYGSLGEALAAQGGRAEEASKAFDDALACCPAGVPPHLQRAYAHYCGAYAALCEEPGDRQRAQELYERGLSVNPTCPTCLGNLPLFLQSCKRPSHEIEAAYKAYFDAYPDSVAVFVKYANFLRHALRAPDRAETILKKAIDKRGRRRAGRLRRPPARRAAPRPAHGATLWTGRQGGPDGRQRPVELWAVPERDEARLRESQKNLRAGPHGGPGPRELVLQLRGDVGFGPE